MILCIGEPLCPPRWTGLPLGRFAPPGHAELLPVAAVQDTLFVWNDGASAARVTRDREETHYRRADGVLDIMGIDEECRIQHDDPSAPGSCLLVAFPTEMRRERGAGDLRAAQFGSRFGFADSHLVGLARGLERQCLDGEPYGRLYTDSLSDALLTHLCVNYANAGPAPPTRARSSRGLSPQARSKVYRYIEDNLAADLGLDELARLVDYSQQHFLRLFRRTFSTTPYQFIVRMRVERAKLLIRDGRLSLAEIALACGFCDQSHFSTCFTRRVGVSPSRYRAGLP